MPRIFSSAIPRSGTTADASYMVDPTSCSEKRHLCQIRIQVEFRSVKKCPFLGTPRIVVDLHSLISHVRDLLHRYASSLCHTKRNKSNKAVKQNYYQRRVVSCF